MRALLQMTAFALVFRPFMALAIGLRVRGRENLAHDAPFIIVANHTSHLDTVSLLSLFPLKRLRDVRPVAAADYFLRNRFVASVTGTLFNILPIERHHITRENNPLVTMRAALDAGQVLLVFPEGTRGSGEGIGEFQSGLGHLLEKTKVPVVPVFLVNMGRSLPKGTLIPVPLFCEVHAGEPFVPQGSRDEIMERIEASVRGLQEAADE